MALFAGSIYPGLSRLSSMNHLSDSSVGSIKLVRSESLDWILRWRVRSLWCLFLYGEVPEWSNGTDSKSVVGVTLPGVRIPPSPPLSFHPYHYCFRTSPSKHADCRCGWGVSEVMGRTCEVRLIQKDPLSHRTWFLCQARIDRRRKPIRVNCLRFGHFIAFADIFGL